MRFTADSSPLKRSLKELIKTLLIGAMLITPIAAAHADEDAAMNPDSRKLKRQILESLDDTNLNADLSSDGSEEPWFSGFRVSKKGPIQYRQTLQIGGDEVSIKLYGPMVKKKPGMRFKVNGLHLGDHPVHIEGFGNVKGGKIRFTIRF
jgi:hypothetical protein